MLRSVLIANRGEIAVRIIRACRDLGITSIVAVSDADRGSMAATLADRAVCVGPARAQDSYLNQNAILAAAVGVGAEAIHPGYGFLAENPVFAGACAEAGITFVGPSAEIIHQMGNKLAARSIAADLGVPLVPGSPEVRDLAEGRAAVARLGLPVLIKAAAGGGGRGIRVVHEKSELESALDAAGAEAEAAFGNRALFIERYVEVARHVEVQILADGEGTTIHLGDRDCSMQRRFQKVIEEASAPNLPKMLTDSMRETAVALAAGIGYESAGTVEFIYDTERAEYYFLEMNTRIQVEHPVTEAVTGIDLVRAQLEIASGNSLSIAQSDVTMTGHAIECRITAEEAENEFRPSPGRITRWEPPDLDGVRLDTHCFEGYVVPPFYDSLLAKLIVHAPDRRTAIDRMQAALRQMVVEGISTTIPYLIDLVGGPAFADATMSTTWIERNHVTSRH